MSELVPVLTAVFVFSSALLLLMKRFSHPSIPAYIIAGIGVGFFFDQAQILQLSQLGIAFLVFIFGLKTEPGRVKSVARESLATTLLQLSVVGIAAYIFAQGIGLDLLNSLYLVIAASISSSLVGLELIENEIRIDLLHGRLSESIHLVQDLFAVLAVLVVSSASLTFSAVSAHIMQGAGIVLLALAIRQFIFPFLAKETGSSTELMMLVGLASLTGFLGLAEVTGVSIVVGAFAAGLSVAKFPHNLEMLETMGSLKDFFSVLFFASLGALLSVPGIEALVIAVALTLSTILLKPVVTAVSLLINGYDRRTSYLAALTLDQVSEFSLIVAIQAFIAGTIAPELFNAIIMTATATMIYSAYTSRHEESIYDLISRYSTIETTEAKLDEWTDVSESVEDHVILVGYDTQGKSIAEDLKEEDEEFVVVENDPEKIIEARQNEDNYVFGDVMDDSTWRRAFEDRARLIVSTVPQRKISLAVLDREEPGDKILRARDVEDAAELLEKGALYVEVPDIIASEQLIDHFKGMMENPDYREELRRKNLLELRQYIQQEEG
ncbi:MAG: cation:proton antiporter [Candidatus Nanohaloarchaea archaeon]